MITVGVDIGSVSAKAVILNQKREILSYNILLISGDSRGVAEEAFNKAIKEANLNKKDIAYVVSTGYGRSNIPFSQQEVTEITCHAAGAHFLFPQTGTILDIGGQDSKAINIDNKGRVLDFAMNDKCAAGTGRFLEVMAQAMGIKPYDLDSFSYSNAAAPVLISSMCTVFAESEVVSLVAEGRSKADIIKGVYEAIAERSITLLHRISIIEPVTMTGGVAKNKGVVAVLEKELNLKINISEEPQIAGALGAALIAQKFIRKNS